MRTSKAREASKAAGPKLNVILVAPRYQINLGYVARTLKNFKVGKLTIVAPRCNTKGKDAIKYSKHAREILEHARIVKDIDSAVRGSDIVLGTTGIWHKSDSAFFNAYTPEQAAEFASNKKSIALLIGRDDIGLTKEELTECDATIFIPANEEYPVLNISHALAIILYEFSKNKFENPIRLAGPAERKHLEILFSRAVAKKSRIRNKKAVNMAFRHVLARGSPTGKELSAISAALSDKE